MTPILRAVFSKLRVRGGARVALAIFGGILALALATVGGAMSIAPLSQSVTDDHMSGLAMPVGTDQGESIITKSLPVQALAKADRMPISVRMALAGSASVANLSGPLDAHLAAHPIAYSVVTQPGYENETYVMPSLAFASLDVGGGNHINEASGAAAIGAMPSQPGETPEIAEEEDDAQPMTLAVPLPHEKPILEPGLPLPKMRPEIPPVGSIPNLGRIPSARPGAAQQETSGVANAGAIPMRQPQKPSTILAFLSPQGEVQQPEVGPPISQPPNTILTPTPFGIPYVVQTQTVDTACLKPELLGILRQIETHYGQKVVVTSGYRSRGREGSLHRTCRAADIIIPGVSSQALAAYARTIPAVGGVGTYCHQSMIHVDIGTPRDWKYGCGSYFAMRDGTAHWGKVPQEIQDD